MLYQVSKIIENEKPDLAVLIDYPGFNLKLSELLYKKGIEIVYYIPPIVFWRKGEKAKKVAKLCSKVITIFPQEYQKYKEAGANAYFVGHPLLDIIPDNLQDEKIYSELGLSNKRRVVGLLPGSRTQEIKNLLPPMCDAIKIISKKMHDLQFILPVASEHLKPLILDIIKSKEVAINIFDNKTYQIMKVSDMMVIASGTATLEATIMERPMIIIYKVSKITEILANFVLEKKVIGLPNIIAQKIIVPEVLQKNVTGKNIAEYCESFLTSSDLRSKMIEELRYVKKQLGEKGAPLRAAQIILQ